MCVDGVERKSFILSFILVRLFGCEVESLGKENKSQNFLESNYVLKSLDKVFEERKQKFRGPKIQKVNFENPKGRIIIGAMVK